MLDQMREFVGEIGIGIAVFIAVAYVLSTNDKRRRAVERDALHNQQNRLRSNGA